MLANVKAADAGGAFDPTKNINQLGKDTAHFSQLDTGNAAAADRALGYKPGDTAPLQQQAAITEGYKLKYGDLANQIRNDAFARKQAAYGSVNGEGLNAGMNYYGNQQNLAMSQMQNPGQLLGAIMPFLNRQNQQQTIQPYFGAPAGTGGVLGTVGRNSLNQIRPR